LGKYPSRAKWGIQISIHWTANGLATRQAYPRPHVILDNFSVGMGKTEEGVGENLLNLLSSVGAWIREVRLHQGRGL